MGRLSDNMGRLREEIEASRSARLAFTFNLKRDVAKTLDGLRDARIAAGKRARAERMRFIGDLAASGSDLRISVLGMRQRYAEDLAGARRAWQGRLSFPGPAGKKQTPVKLPIRADAQTRVMEIEQAEIEKASFDDLTAIAGIGPGRAARLNAAGIHSIKELAQCAPDNLLKILGRPLKMTVAERLVAEARKQVGPN